VHGLQRIKLHLHPLRELQVHHTRVEQGNGAAREVVQLRLRRLLVERGGAGQGLEHAEDGALKGRVRRHELLRRHSFLFGVNTDGRRVNDG